MSFARHQTFYIRANWLSKGLEEIARNPKVFSGPDATTRLGIGKNMVEALRFWLVASGLAVPTRDGMTLTEIGAIIRASDPYFENAITWFLVHYGLCSDLDLATSWYLLFNRYRYSDFDEGQFLDLVAREYPKPAPAGSVRRDFDCIVSTYVNETQSFGTPEDNITCPLRKLGLIDRVERGLFRKTRPQIEIPSEVLYYVIRGGRLSKDNTQEYRTISDMYEPDRSIGRVFNLGLDDIFSSLQKLEERGLVSYYGTYGQHTVTIVPADPLALIEDAYQKGGAL